MSATLLLVLLLGIIEIGRALAEYKVLVNQVETAARYLSTRPPGAGHAEASCLVRSGITACGSTTTPVLKGLSSATVQIADSTTKANLLRAPSSSDALGVRMNLVEVSLSGYRFQVLGGGLGGNLFGTASDASGGILFPPIRSVHRQSAG